MTSTHPARVVGRLAAALVFVAARFSLEIPRPAAADPAGFAFLKVPASARASAMGGAYASVADGVDGALWNPAALEGVKGVQILASHYEYFANLRHEQFTVAGRMFAGGISASLRALYSEPIPERDALGNLIGTFGSHDLEFGIGYGRAIAPGVRLGGSLKVVRERIADASASTWTAGAGATWERSRGHGLRLSADVHDLGPSTKFTIDGTDGSPVALPTGLRLGASYGAVIGGLDARAALETAMLSGQSGVSMLGLELAHPSGIALRGGWRTGDTESSWALGAGWAVKRVKLDYAFVPFRSDLGDTHRFSIGAQF